MENHLGCLDLDLDRHLSPIAPVIDRHDHNDADHDLGLDIGCDIDPVYGRRIWRRIIDIGEGQSSAPYPRSSGTNSPTTSISSRTVTSTNTPVLVLSTSNPYSTRPSTSSGLGEVA